MAITLRTDEELDHVLNTLALAESISKQEVIRRALIERYERTIHEARFENAASRMLDRWGDVIDRLGRE
ncbi:MAG: ribbon-helix-helix protein, CopG family [Actinobacteria bacterium]|jgi:predicted transcriptional regulator|uniref:Unannotated protein n=1 Tax=freshwater metagenome TaxID=449393 RepID=A0A6J6WGC5_9ZZZZ|nr:ribbon-helix-helix protein, CopG family [Actinomycetota bacterium]